VRRARGRARLGLGPSLAESDDIVEEGGEFGGWGGASVCEVKCFVFCEVEVFEEFGAKEEERDDPNFIDECPARRGSGALCEWSAPKKFILVCSIGLPMKLAE